MWLLQAPSVSVFQWQWIKFSLSYFQLIFHVLFSYLFIGLVFWCFGQLGISRVDFDTFISTIASSQGGEWIMTEFYFPQYKTSLL